MNENGTTSSEPTDNQPRPLSLRISVTDRCALRCLYCMPPGGITKRPHSDILTFEEITRFVATLKQAFNVTKVHLTGGEPLVRRNICQLISNIAGTGITDIALTTNGQFLAELAQALRDAGLTRVNVSLDSLNPQVYDRITRGGNVERTLAGIMAAARAGLKPVKLNTVVLRGYNDSELPDLVQFAFEKRCHIRFLELMPIGCAAQIFDSLFVPISEIREKLNRDFWLVPSKHRNGSSSLNFHAAATDGQFGTIGLIASHSHPFCSSCTRIRLTSTGQLVTCLATGDGIEVGTLLRSGSTEDLTTIQQLVARELGLKCTRSAFTTEHPMAQIGG